MGYSNRGFVSTSTMDNITEKKWDLMQVYESPFTVEQLLQTLNVIDSFKKKYPNDEIITDFEDVVRQEICMMFGGNIEDLEK